MEEQSKLKTIIYWNLGIYFSITILEIVAAKGILLLEPEGTFMGPLFMILSVITIGLQSLVNFVLSVTYFIKGNKDLGKSYLLSLLLITLIGYPLCFAGFVL